MAKKSITERLKTFKDVCAATGKNEQDYDIPASASIEEKAAMCLKRVKLIALAFNGDQKVRMADTSQWKYFPWFRIIPDETKPAGFGLSSYDFAYVNSLSSLGARPKFLSEAHAMYAGKQFIAEFEQWAQYEDLTNQ